MDRLSELPNFTLVEAAAVTGLSRVTIRRYLDAGKFPNARRDTSTARRPAPWLVPRSDLRALGLTIREPEMEHQVASETPPPPDQHHSELLVELATQRTAASERQRVIDTLLGMNHRLLALVERLAISSNDRQSPRSAVDLPGSGSTANQPDPETRKTDD